MSQIQTPKLTECKRCKTNGFPGQMIGFQRDPTGRKKDDGKPFWILLNGDMSGHVHVEPGTVLGRIPQLEQVDKPPKRPDLSPPSVTSLPQPADSTMVIMALTQLADSIKLLALSNICSTDEEREQVRKGCMAQ